MKPRNYIANHKCLISVGILLIITGTVLLLISPMIFNNLIDGELILTPNNHMYSVWKKTPIPLTLEFYLFNWLNPEDLRNTDVKPHLQELGPYKFIETKEKQQVVWNPNGTVSFRQQRWWYFDAKRSNGSLSDLVTTLNPISLTASAQSQKLGSFLKSSLSLTISTMLSDVYITKTVGELLFDGYKDTMIDIARTMPSLDGVELPPYDKFGWFYMRNGSLEFDGLMTMGTGVGDVPFGAADRWNYKQKTSFYEGECGKVRGSAGEFWPPYVSKHKDILLFSPDMCTVISLEFDKEVLVNGITGYRFIGSEKTLDNGTRYPENLCYCTGECIPAGALNVTACRYGAPGFVSFPHFYAADSYYADQFEGLSPDPQKHELSITLEPRTGIPLSVSAKFQINLLLTRNEKIGLYSDVPRLFFPMIWLQQEVTIPEDVAHSLKQLLSLPFISEVISICVIVLGFLILATLLIMYFYNKVQISMTNKQVKMSQFVRESEPLNEKESSNSIIVIKQPDALQKSDSNSIT